MYLKRIYTTALTMGLILSFSLLSACISLLDHTITVTQEQLQQKLQAVPIEPLTVLQVFELNLSKPIVSLDAANERIRVSMDTVLTAPFAPALRGNAVLSGKLRFDVATNAVLLTEPKIESIDIAALGSRNKELVTALAGRLGEGMLNNYPLYTFKPEELTILGIRFIPTQMKVTSSGLEVTIAPK